MTGSVVAGRQPRLLVSIHDVGPKFEREVDKLHALIGRIIPADKIAMLIVPNHWGEAPLAGNTSFAYRLRDWHQAGIELFLHGWFHRDTAEHAGAAAKFKARHMTAGEGEFLGLDRATAAARMADGRKLIEDIIEAPVAGFIAPAWLYGEGAKAAMADTGFELAEDHMRVWAPRTGEVLARGPVVTWASRSRMRIASSLAVGAVARAGLFRQPVLRLAVHPGDIHVPALVSSIERTLGRLAETRTVARYSDLLSRSEIRLAA